MNYREFLERKIDIAPMSGIEVDPSEVNPVLKDHQRVSVLWALRGGRRGIFARFGLGKTAMQIEWCRLLQKHEGGQVLIVMPLNVLASCLEHRAIDSMMDKWDEESEAERM